MYFDVADKVFRETEKNAAKLCFAGADMNLSWAELKNLSDKICMAFEKANIPAGAPVLIYGDKEVFFLAAILSCYRKDLPFVPLGPELPQKRIESIMTQTKSEAMIVCGEYANIPEVAVVIKDDLSIAAKNTKFEVQYNDLAYILFTSGSSGEPKGVLITKNNIASFTKWFCANFPVSDKTVFINQASFLFDISLADLFGTLQTGGTVAFNSPVQTKDLSFFTRLKKYEGNYWNSTPSFAALCLANKDFSSQNFPQIKCFTLSGEILTPFLAKELKNRFPSAKIINAYGPTEATIFSSCVLVEPYMLEEKNIPIAKISAENISIENGELVIFGNQVGMGYLNGIAFENKFRTGDLAEVRNNFIYYKGRNDDQVKFNGFRIELNEIKAVLEKLNSVQKAECVPLEIHGKIKRLLAFVELRKGREEEINSIKEELKMILPAYMIPSEIIPVKEFPYTVAFKTDRKKLLQTYLDL